MIIKKVELAPALKWVGGKRQLLDVFQPLFPKDFSTYCEPFLGGGAVLFHLRPQVAIVNDANEELMNVYRVIKTQLNRLLEELKSYENTSEFYYAIRDIDRDPSKYKKLSQVKRAARILYLNKTCFNGLYRVNNAGEFNVPYGKYKNPNIVNEIGLTAIHNYFNQADIKMESTDFSKCLLDLPETAFVYFDPPYDPVSTTSNFTGYAKGGFPKEEQERLCQVCNSLDKRGIRFMLSNSATPFIRELYSNFNITIVKAKRAINSVGTKRGEVDEVVIRNYE
ncbi:MAG: DNA adenine methylase [Thermoguttaceae bacterium]|nr:DNA adenine methylase [Thermoguttaceae bacterium]